MTNLLAMTLLQTESEAPGSAAGAAIGMVFTVLMLGIALLMIAAMWKIFEKAGEPGWAAIIPIYNFVILLKIAGKPVWWLVLFIIPIVNFVAAIMVSLALAQNFGKSAGFGVGLAFLGVIFAPMLAWGDARYQPQTAR